MARYYDEDAAAIVPRQAEAAAATTSGLTSTTIIGIGVGIGSLLIIGFIILGLFFIRKRNAHKREMAQLEHGATPADVRQNMRQIARPVSAASCNRFTQGGWDQLGSNETVELPLETGGKRKRASASLPERIKHRSVLALKPWTRKHLSVIAESPRSTALPREASLPIFEAMNTTSPLAKGRSPSPIPTDLGMPLPPGSPKFNVLPSFAIRSPGQYGSGIANGRPEKPKLTLITRSVSMGVLTDDGAVFGDDLQHLPNDSKSRRPEMHARSVSLGAPSSRPPSGPVPPLPVTSITSTRSKEERLRQVVCLSRMSSSSSDSASSSVLVVSPILERRDVEQPLQSPTVEELVETKDNAELRTVANRQWRNPRISGPRPGSNMRIEKPRSSVRAKIVRSSTDSALTQHWRNDSTSSNGSVKISDNRLSVPQICSAEAISVSRVSSSNSLLGPGSVTKVITPARRTSSSNFLLGGGSGSSGMNSTPTRRVKRVTSVSSVSADGSPVERRRRSVLHEVSGNAAPSKDNTPTRQPSNATVLSRSSSNGNPFHWDTASTSSIRVTKPSALKGSPNARKGHRRQNCVRISTLTPQVLGPSASQRRSRSASPATLLNRVLEERESDEIQRPHTEPVITPAEERESFLLACSSRGPNANTFNPNNLRVQTLRASLTPSSPTLSTWNASEQEQWERPLPMPSQPSRDSIDSSVSRMSGDSFHIPRFPSPAGKSRISISSIQCDVAPMPEFVGLSPVDTLSPLDNISPTDFRNSRRNSMPFALHMSSEEPTPDIPSSPPMPVSKTDEYDPASPPFKSYREQESEQACRSSGFFPFATDSLDLMGDKISAKDFAEEVNDSAEQPVIPEKNPKRETVKLTSENASAVMASQSLNFPGDNVPVLLPPKRADDDDDYCPLPRWEPDTSYEDITLEDDDEEDRDPTPRQTLARRPSLSTIVQESSSPPPAPPAPRNPRERLSSPLGPREAPAKSLLRNVTELRRMNSEVKIEGHSRQSRNYTRLGREASPLLPWVETDRTGSDNMHREESSNSLFDFDFDNSTHEHHEHHEDRNALDEIDFAALSLNIEGALAGFNADYRFSQATLKSSPPPLNIKRRGSDKENQEQQQRPSSVWDDGEKYWQQQQQNYEDGDSMSRPTTAESGTTATTSSSSVTPYYIVSSPVSKSPAGRSSYYPDSAEKVRTVDPRLLSTPTAQRSSIMATPKSLYDAEGFLRT